MNVHRNTLNPVSLPDDNDRRAYLRTQFERGGVDQDGNPRMAKIAEYADRVHRESAMLLQANDAEVRERFIDALTKEETARELFANGTVHPHVIRVIVTQRLRVMTGLAFTAADERNFMKAYRVIASYVKDGGKELKNGTGLPKPRAYRL